MSTITNVIDWNTTAKIKAERENRLDDAKRHLANIKYLKGLSQ